MARIFVSGSADGLGLLAARWLTENGHEVVLHARNESRAAAALASLPSARGVVVGDVSTLDGMVTVAREADALGRYDAVIHNVAVGYREAARVETADGLSHVFAVNTLAPYVLTARMAPVARLVYLTSGLHRAGDPSLQDLAWRTRPWNGYQAYCDSKLHDILLAFAVARLRPATRSNAVHPGWVATKMGGSGAPDDLRQGAVTQAWLAAGVDPATNVSGEYFFHQKRAEPFPVSRDAERQDALLEACRTISGIALPLAP